MKKNSKLYYIISGEASGDLHGSHLIKSIKKIDSNIHFRGLGGPLMAKEGFKALCDFSRLSVMGFVEIIKDIRFFLKLKKQIYNDILQTSPEKIILIDYPGFNLRLAKKIKKSCSIPIIYYVSPQIWAWKENRIKLLKNFVDSLIVLFPFEKIWFKKRNIDVHFFGHPLIDVYNNMKLTNVQPKNTIGFFPGSRSQEIKKHLPIFCDLIKNLSKNNPKLKFIVSRAPGSNVILFKKIKLLKNVYLDSDESFKTFSKINVGVVASGTATLECAISKTPFLVIYKTSFLSWLIAKSFLSIPYISIVNILANKEIVKEFVQYDIKQKNIAAKINHLLENPNKTKNLLEDVSASLGDGGAYKKTAKHIVEY